MSESTPAPSVSIGKLILIPSLITLGVTILRLVGELQHWTPILFNRSAGGGGAAVGISWLPLIFGPYFAVKLVRAGQAPASAGRSIGFPIAGLAIMILGGFVGFSPPITYGKMTAGYALMAVAGVIAAIGWSALGKTLVAYAYAARIPVAVIMYFAISGNWGTHYDVLPPEYTGPTDLVGKYIMIGLLPQLIIWIVFTVIVGSLLGSIAAMVARRRPAPVSASGMPPA